MRAFRVLTRKARAFRGPVTVCTKWRRSNSIPSPLRRTLNLRHNRLDDLRRCYGISLADRTLHGALIVTRLLPDVLRHLRGV